MNDKSLLFRAEPDVIGNEYLGIKPAFAYEFLRLSDGEGDCFGLVEAGEKNGQLLHFLPPLLVFALLLSAGLLLNSVTIIRPQSRANITEVRAR